MADHVTHHEHHHELPTAGRELTAMSISATLHCLTGCAVGEIAGMAIGTALGFSQWGTVALSVALAFLFGYSFTSVPLLRAGLALPSSSRSRSPPTPSRSRSWRSSTTSS